MNWARGASWAATLALGAAGGWVFHALGLPLPWMLGAIAATMMGALGGVPLAVPLPLRAVMLAVLGLMLGGAFTPAILDRVAAWGVSLAALAVYVLAATAVVALYFRRIVKSDKITSYFSAAPGGLTEMVFVGGALGGDERAISLAHTTRILLIVATVPLWFRLTENYGGGSLTGAGMGSLSAISAIDAWFLGLSAIVGAALAKAMRLPAATLTGPMLFSAALHILGLTQSSPPAELVGLAQVVTGAAIGSRFSGITKRELGRTMLAACGSTGMMLALSLVFALGLAAATDLPASALVLAFVPGGLAEMCLIAIAMGADVAFVSTHHVGRILLVVVLAPLAFRLYARAAKCRPTSEKPGSPPPG